MSASKNTNLNEANKAKRDEFYTQLSDIEAELWHYEQYFKGVTVYCNCDNPFKSNFFYYFASRFKWLGLKRLIATCCDSSLIADAQLSRKAYKVILNDAPNIKDNGTIDTVKTANMPIKELKGNRDFRSDECVELLKQADIVVTNP